MPPLEETVCGLRIGLLLSIAVIFLLLAANFQSVRLALVVLATIPAVLCGVLLMLAASGTTLNVQSFMGAIMAVGVAVANSILFVTFAEMRRREGVDGREAAVHGGREPFARDPDDGRRHDRGNGSRWRWGSAKARNRRRRSDAR